MAAAVLPLLHLDLQQPFPGRVVCSDAAPGGHGLAYSRIDPSEAQRWARMAEFRGCPTALVQDWDLAREQDDIPLRRAVLPLGKLRWSLIGRPGGWHWIHLEEARTVLWGLESRLHFRDEQRARAIHVNDNGTAVGAMAKGRSSCRALNAVCRKAAAVCFAADVRPFFIWTDTATNPADLPSSWHGLRAGAWGGRR